MRADVAVADVTALRPRPSKVAAVVIFSCICLLLARFLTRTTAGLFGTKSFHLIDPLMLAAAAYAELGDGNAALHRLQSALSIAEALCVCAANRNSVPIASS